MPAYLKASNFTNNNKQLNNIPAYLKASDFTNNNKQPNNIPAYLLLPHCERKARPLGVYGMEPPGIQSANVASMSVL